MKLENVSQTVKSSGVQEHNKFRIQMSAKAFYLVASNYSNPIKAFIRELSTNAYESHQILGTEATPFDVYLPTTKDSNFVVRDYGPGLSPTEISEIYTVLFCSTKDQSNEFDGCFGIGSKSPFAYCKNSPFAVTSINGGMKYYYTCYLGTDGEPCCDLLHSIKSDEPTGIEVSVSIKSNDIYKVHEEAASVYGVFQVKPNLKRKYHGITYTDYTQDVIMEGKDFKIYTDSRFNHIRMGNVLYPIDYSILGFTKPYSGIIIEAKRGSVVPDLSREQLKYGGQTSLYLDEKLREVAKFITTEVSKKLDTCTCYHDAVIEATRLVSGLPGMRVNMLSYNGEKLDSGYKTLVNGKVHSTNNGKVKYSKSQDFGYNQSNLFVCVDTKAFRPAITHLLKSQSNKYWNIVLCEKVNLSACAKELGMPEDRFTLTSKIPYVPPKKHSYSAGTGHKSLVVQYSKSSGWLAANWKSIEVELDKYDGYYVEYYANKIKYKGKEPVTPHYIDMIFNIMGIKPTQVLGIRSETLKKCQKKMVKAKNLVEEFEKFLYNKQSDFIAAEVAKLTLAAISNKRSSIDKFVSIVTTYNVKCPKHVQDIMDKFASYTKLYNSMQYDTDGIYYKLLGIQYHEFVKTAKADKVLADGLNGLAKQFPLLEAVDTVYTAWTKKELSSYILGKGF